jgi:lipopolysaccharide export LptBFGC system permease protein LptF
MTPRASTSRAPALSQRRFLVQQHFELLPDDYLLFRAKTPSQQNEVRLDLFELDPHPRTLMHSSKYLLWGSVAWWLLALVCVLLGAVRGFDSYLESIVIWTVLAVICTAAYMLSRKTMLVYSHKRTGAVLLAMYLLAHNQSEREAFVTELNATLERLSVYSNRDVYKQQSKIEPPKFKRDISMLN